MATGNLYSFGDRDGEPVLIALDREATVLIGPNGSGKSNVLRAIEFVRDQSLRKGTQWTGRRDTPRFAGAQASSWTEARLEFADAAQVVVQVICRFDDQGALVQHVIIVAGREVASTRTDFFKGTARWLSEDDEAGRLRVHTADTQAGEPFYAVADLDQVHPNLVVILRYLESLRVYRKWRTSSNASERPADARFDAHLTDDLSNLSGVLGRILKNGPARERLYAEMRQVLPGFESVEVRRPDFDDWYFVEHGATLHADSLSDGSRQFLTLVALLLDPEPTGPLLLDEPDLLLHPDAVIRLGRLLSDAAATRQIVVSTHSSMLLDVLADDQLERVRVVERDADSSVIRMLGSEALEDWLEDFTLADAWGRGAFGGNP